MMSAYLLYAIVLVVAASRRMSQLGDSAAVSFHLHVQDQALKVALLTADSQKWSMNRSFVAAIEVVLLSSVNHFAGCSLFIKT